MRFAFAGDLRLPRLVLCLAILGLSALPLPAQEPATAPTNPASPPALGEVLKLALMESLSEEFVDDRHWNKQAPRWDGFHVRGVRLIPREKLVNHGFWRRYKLKVIEPEESVQIAVEQLPPLPDGSLPFSLSLALRARCEATFVAWNWGIKGLNGRAVSDVKLAAQIQLLTSPEWKFSLDKPLPRLDLHPRVGEVSLRLRDIRMQELGLLDGKLAEVVGDGMEEIAGDILEKQSGKVREKLQKQIEK